MASVSFTGNLGKVQELKFNNDGQARLGFSVGESHSRFDKQSNSWIDEGTTWWAVTVFGKKAENLAEVLQEGAKQRLTVSGRSKTRTYEKQDGSQGTSLDVIADEVGIVPRPQQNTSQQPAQQPQQGQWGQQPASADTWSRAVGQAPQSAGWGNGDQESAPF